MKQKEKLGIIVPYRDREEHLEYFVPSIKEFLDKQGIPFCIYVIDQGNHKSFNRGKLLNVGYELFKDECDYFCFHDVDLIPQEDSCDYSVVNRPTHLASELSKFNYQLVYDEYFGGVTLFPKKHFEMINGFSNEYWGWGYEDDDLLYRCKKRGVPLDQLWLGIEGDVKEEEKRVLQFIDKSHLKLNPGERLSDAFNKSFTVQFWFYPSHDLILTQTDNYDEFVILSKSDFFKISFTSGLQIKASLIDKNGKEWMVLTNRLTEQWLHYVFTYDHEKASMRCFVNGVESLASPSIMGGPPATTAKSFIYLGCDDPFSGNTNTFNGFLNKASVWDVNLNWREVKSLFNKGQITDPSFEIESYDSIKNLVYNIEADYVDFKKLVDLSGLGSDTVLSEVVQRNINVKFGYVSLVPYRKNGRYTCLEHKESGWENTKFRDFNSRENQIRFFNKVKQDVVDIKDDGLSNLKYKILQADTFMGDNKYVKVDI